MPRVKRGTHRRDARKKTLKQASGYFLTKSKLNRAAQEAVERGLKFAYVGRKNKKREFRSLWIVRINAACREAGISYSQFLQRAEGRPAGTEPQGAGGCGAARRCGIPAIGFGGQDRAGSQGLRPRGAGKEMTASHQPDPLASLEDRIEQAVQLVGRLRQEKDAALAQAAEARAEAGRVTDELAALQAERKQVRTRIEKLLEQIEQLSNA